MDKAGIKRDGYTLVELLVAGIILFIIMTSLMAIIIHGSRFNKEDMLRRRAYQVMEEFIERHKYGFYDELLRSDSTTNWDESLNWINDSDSSVIYDNGGSLQVRGWLQYAVRRERYIYGNSGASDYGYTPALSFRVRIFYESEVESLSTVFTDIPIN